MTERKMVCEVCGSGPGVDGESIFRTGGKGPGVDPHWRCGKHSKTPIDPVVATMVAVIESTDKTKH